MEISITIYATTAIMCSLTFCPMAFGKNIYTEDGWEKVCVKNVSFIDWIPEHPSFNWSQPITQIFCRLTDTVLSLDDFRTWTNKTNNKPIALSIQCEDNSKGILRFPWPMKASNLVYLKIFNCGIKDQFTEYFTDQTSDIVQNLRVLEMENVKKEMIASFYESLTTNYTMISRDVHCLSVLLEKYVAKNISYTAILDTTFEKFKASVKMWYRLEQLIPYKCNFVNLQYVDESNNKYSSQLRFVSHQYKSRYPRLRFYNFSNRGYPFFPEELNEWRFSYPRMEYLDLSRNRISSFNIKDYGTRAYGVGVIDLTYNNITVITEEEVNVMKSLKTAVVDLRHNPLSCECYKNEFLFKYLKANPRLSLVKGMENYEYIRNVSCASPERLQGIPFGRVLEEDILCEEELSDTFVVTVSVLSVSLAIVGILGVLVLYYRKEINILVYTRVGIVLSRDRSQEKKFDAFISYSSKDDTWVINTLVKKLENNDKGPSFKLCVHHRDFEVGAAISDNVVKSVESSRHTVLVVSRNFTQSEWCIYEFRTAMHQSLIERRKHMIIILLEHIPKEELDPDLRKCLGTFTYIEAGDRLFWDKMIYSISRGKEKQTKI